IANGEDVCSARLNRDHGWFAEHNSAVSYVYEGIGCAQVYTNVIGKQAFNLCKHEWLPNGAEIKSRIVTRSRLLVRRADVQRFEVGDRWSERVGSVEAVSKHVDSCATTLTGKIRLLVGSTRICRFCQTALNLVCGTIVPAFVSSSGSRCVAIF